MKNRLGEARNCTFPLIFAPWSDPTHFSKKIFSCFLMMISCLFQHFREQGIDGSTLILLKEDHLVTTMKMRLGSVLKFKAALAKKMGSCPICLHCVHCHNEMTNDTKSASAASATDSLKAATNGDDQEIDSKENNRENNPGGQNHESKK